MKIPRKIKRARNAIYRRKYMINKRDLIEIAENDGLVKYSEKLLSKYNLPNETREILQEMGVPKYAAPYISFIEEESGGGNRLSNYYDLSVYENSEYIEQEELDKIKVYFQSYIVLGNSENDVFVLNEKFRVIRVDHETLDEYYINYTLNDFLESLSAYKKSVDKVLNRYNELVFFDDKITEDDIKTLKYELLKIDKNSFAKESFWSSEIERLEENIK